MSVLGRLPLGILLPETVLQSSWFSVLAAFVAINTVMYGALALASVLPKVYPASWFNGRNRRTTNRGIVPTQSEVDERREREERQALLGGDPGEGTGA